MYVDQIVESRLVEDDLLSGQTILDRMRSLSTDHLGIEAGPVHGAVEVGDVLGALADQGTDFVATFHRQGKALEDFRSIDGVEQTDAGKFLVKTPRLQVVVHTDGMSHVGLFRVFDLIRTDLGEESGEFLEGWWHEG